MALVKIRYKGLSDVRVISVKDAEKHGVKLSRDLVWDRVGEVAGGPIPIAKRPKFPNAAQGIVVDGLSDELLKVLRDEGTFTITELDSDTGVEKDEIITGQALDDSIHSEAVIDSTTGQRSNKK